MDVTITFPEKKITFIGASLAVFLTQSKKKAKQNITQSHPAPNISAEKRIEIHIALRPSFFDTTFSAHEKSIGKQ